jgi:hypothetical protein
MPTTYRNIGNLAIYYDEEAPTFYDGCATPSSSQDGVPAHDFLSGYTTPGPAEREASKYSKVSHFTSPNP